MKSKVIVFAVFVFAGVYVMRCTSAVAPKNEGGTASTDTNGGTSSKTSTKTITTSSTESETTTDSGSNTASNTATNTETEAKAIGEITAEDTDIPNFAAKSVYGSYTAASKTLTILIQTTKLTEDALKEVEKYECKACSGADDVHCKKDTTTADSISISWLGSLSTGGSAEVTADGFPKDDDAEKTGSTDGTGLSISLTSKAAEFDNKGTIKFVAGSRPESATDDFELDVDLTTQGGKKYKAHLKSNIITFPTQPTAPTCGADEYLSATYK